MNTSLLQHLPDELLAGNYFVCWRREIRGGKLTKVPINPRNGKLASVTDPSTWGSFDVAISSAEKFRCDGVGRVLTKEQELIGVDLDHVRDSQTGELTQFAENVVKTLDSYCEITPSGTGLRVWIIGVMPGPRCRKDNIEIYGDERYFTLTGNHLHGTRTTIERRQEELEQIHASLFQETKARSNENGQMPTPIDRADSVIIERMLAKPHIKRLWEGDTSAHGDDDSRADSALMCHCAFWTGKDSQRMERIFGQSKLADRDKWRRRSDYRQRTIADAISKTQDVWKPNQQAPASEPRVEASTTQSNPRPPKTSPLHLTDLGNAERLIAQQGDDLVFIPAKHAWAIWDGRRFKIDEVLDIESRGKQLVKGLYRELSKIDDTDERKKFAKLIMDCESAARIKAMIAMAKSEVAMRAEDFDADPDLLNFRNGTLHLPTGDLRPHNRKDLITKLVDYNFDPSASCPLFLSVLKQIMGGEQDIDRTNRLVGFLQKAFGYSLTGHTREKACFIFHGPENNGKTTLLNLFHNTLEEYSTQIQIESLMVQKFQSTNAQADLADLQGKRFAYTSETREGQRLSEALLKRITQGQGKIRAVRKYENPFSFPETHKLFMDCNHRPKVTDDGAAIWNRLRLVPFDVIIPKEKQDKDLPKKLEKEAEGILAWAAEGAKQWYAEGLQPPAEVDAATSTWQRENNVIEAFLDECCTRKKNDSISKDSLYQAYHEWAEKNGEFIEKKRAFGGKLLARGFDESQTNKSRFWLGLALISDTSDT